MAYNLTTGSGTIITIADGTIDTTSTSLALPGRNYSGYGQPVDQDLIRLMEHFASSTIPTKPLPGQLWFDTTTSPGTLKLYPTNGGTAGWANIMTNPVSGNLKVNGNANIVGDVEIGGNLTLTDPTKRIYATLANAATFTNDGTGGSSPVVYNAGASQKISWNTVGAPQSANPAAQSPYAIGVSNPANTSGINGSTSSFYGGPWTMPATMQAATPSTTLTGTWLLGAGTTLNATYADLAERFEADSVYDAGTVVELGGDREITAVRDELSDRVFGVVSKTAAFLMNGSAGSDSTHPAIAVGGRVPVKVIGTVRKGDRLVSAGNGYARAANKDEAGAFNTIGRALKNKDTDGLGTVEAFVSIK